MNAISAWSCDFDQDIFESIEIVLKDELGVSREELRFRCRIPGTVRPRWIAMWLAHSFGASYSEIGRHWRKHHTTVMHGVRRIVDLIAANDEIRLDIEYFKKSVEARRAELV